MRVGPDTNVLARAITRDGPTQSAAAQALLSKADAVVLGIVVLCELVRVLARAYRTAASHIAEAIRVLIAGESDSVDRPLVEAGLAMLDAEGDFADGVIAHAGSLADADFVSFHRRAVTRLRATREPARLLG